MYLEQRDGLGSSLKLMVVVDKVQNTLKDTIAGSLHCFQHCLQQSYSFRNALHKPCQTDSTHQTCTRSHHRRSWHSHCRVTRIRRLLG